MADQDKVFIIFLLLLEPVYLPLGGRPSYI